MAGKEKEVRIAQWVNEVNDALSLPPAGLGYGDKARGKKKGKNRKGKNGVKDTRGRVPGGAKGQKTATKGKKGGKMQGISNITDDGGIEDELIDDDGDEMDIDGVIVLPRRRVQVGILGDAKMARDGLIVKGRRQRKPAHRTVAKTNADAIHVI